jgi:hypothetical protein
MESNNTTRPQDSGLHARPEARPKPSGPAPGRYRRFRWLTLTIGGLGLAAAIWTVAWQITALITEASIESWMNIRRGMGEQLTYSDMITRSGYPFAVRHEIKAPVWTIRRGGLETRMTTPVLVVENTPIDPYQLKLEADQGVDIWSGGPTGMNTVRAKPVRVSVRVGDYAPESGGLVAANLVAEDQTGSYIASLERIEFRLQPDDTEPESGAQAARQPVSVIALLDADITGLVLSERFQVPFSGPADLSTRMAIEGGLPSYDPAGLALWRDAGGVIDIRALSVYWAPLDLRGDGAFALDRNLRPQGAATISAAGLPAILDQVVAMGGIKPNEASWIKLALIALAKRPAEGGAPRVTAPLTIQNGQVSLGPLTIGRVGSVIQ